jgi:hypothetical protein
MPLGLGMEIISGWPARSCMAIGFDHRVHHTGGAGLALAPNLPNRDPGLNTRQRFVPDSPLEGAVRCELVSVAGPDSGPDEFLESIKKGACHPFSCNQNLFYMVSMFLPEGRDS